MLICETKTNSISNITLLCAKLFLHSRVSLDPNKNSRPFIFLIHYYYILHIHITKSQLKREATFRAPGEINLYIIAIIYFV